MSVLTRITELDASLHARFSRLQRLGIGAVVWTTLMEGLSLFNRFVVGIESTRDTAALAPYLGGIRIHHGYMGLVVLCMVWRGRSLSHRILIGMSLGAVFSDIVHHILLGYLTGSGEWDVFYPGYPK